MRTDAASSAVDALQATDLDPLFWRPRRIGVESAWTGHTPFAFWIVIAAQPRQLVELGTHTGVSYSAFCDAVSYGELSTRCYAVDTWRGDPHAGEYGENIFIDFSNFHDAHYAAFSQLLRCTFDEALDRFDDGSIDLLHIDGFHTYDAVRADFEKWLPKCSDRAVVLLHDTNVHERNFGVWKLFAELAGRYPHFEFLHEHGLGVVAVGPNPPPAVAALCTHTAGAPTQAIRERFALLGERWKYEWNFTRFNEHVRSIEAEKELLAQQTKECKRLDECVKAQQAEAQQMEAELTRLKVALTAESAMRIRSAARAANARKEALEARLQLEAMGAAEGDRIDAIRRRLEEAGQIAHGTASAVLRRRINELELSLAQAQADREAIEYSTIWRATRPLRTLASQMPRGTRRLVRESTQVAWWTMTLQLPRRLAARRRTVDHAPPRVSGN